MPVVIPSLVLSLGFEGATRSTVSVLPSTPHPGRNVGTTPKQLLVQSKTCELMLVTFLLADGMGMFARHFHLKFAQQPRPSEGCQTRIADALIGRIAEGSLSPSFPLW